MGNSRLLLYSALSVSLHLDTAERKLGLPAQQKFELEREMQRLVDTGRMSPGVMRSVFGPETTDKPPAFDEPAGECRKSAESAAKPRLELVPFDVIEEIAEVLTFGAEKYEANNWARGARWGRYFAALLRHLFAWWRGEDLDPETGKSHLAHAGCCLFFLMAYQRHGWGEDDRFRGPDSKPFTKHDGAA